MGIAWADGVPHAPFRLSVLQIARESISRAARRLDRERAMLDENGMDHTLGALLGAALALFRHCMHGGCCRLPAAGCLSARRRGRGEAPLAPVRSRPSLMAPLLFPLSSPPPVPFAPFPLPAHRRRQMTTRDCASLETRCLSWRMSGPWPAAPSRPTAPSCC